MTTFSILEGRTLMSPGVYRTQYETNITVETNPGIKSELEKYKEGIFRKLQIDDAVAAKDRFFSITLSVKLGTMFGQKAPGGKYTLVITDSCSIGRIPTSFKLSPKEA